MNRPLRNHRCQITKLRSQTETAAAVVLAIVAWACRVHQVGLRKACEIAKIKGPKVRHGRPSGMSLLLLLSPTASARGSRDARREVTVDPVAGVNGLDELIVYPVELVRIMREPMKVERCWA